MNYTDFSVSFIKIFTFFIEVIDKIVEAVMTRTIYRLNDSQKHVMIHIFFIVGLALVNGYNLTHFHSLAYKMANNLFTPALYYQ